MNPLQPQKKKSNGCLYFILGIMAVIFIILYTYKEEHNTVRENINAPAYTTRGRLGEIQIQNTPTATRRAVNLEVPKYLSDNDIDAEIRSAINTIYEKYPDVNAIMVRVFEINNKTCVATGVFAPYGNWNVTSFPNRKDYQVKISIHRENVTPEDQQKEFFE